jgi:hypothetical protein
MKFLFEIKMPTEIGNKKLEEGSMLKDISKVLDQLHPEAVYFSVSGGKRAIYMIIEMTKSEKLPEIAEQFWLNLHADVYFNLILDADEFKRAGAGIEKVVKSKLQLST